MNATELNRICQITSVIVDYWLSNQDELIRGFHIAALETIAIAGFVPMGAFVTSFRHADSVLLEDFGRREIEERADVFLRSEFQELSPVFAGLYADFNRRYFDGWLPSCHVRIMHSLPWFDEPVRPMMSEIDMDRRELALQYNGHHDYMVGRLIELMAYLRVGLDNREALKRELDRLSLMGAPTPDEVKKLSKEIRLLQQAQKRHPDQAITTSFHNEQQQPKKRCARPAKKAKRKRRNTKERDRRRV
jgi:hypothetical protein